MRVLFISANTEQINILPIPLGLNCVAVATRAAGHEIRVLDLMNENDGAVADAISCFAPDVIGISVRNIDDQNMSAPRFLLEPIKPIVAECRSRSNTPIVLGGAGYSIFPQSALDYLGADLGIRGEAEAAFPELLKRLGTGAEPAGTPGLYIREKGSQGRRSFIRDLDALPLPDPAISAQSATDPAQSWMPIQTRRGCPMQCSYCSTPAIEGILVRKRRIDLVMKQIAEHVAVGFRNFYFVDNIFNIPSSYAKDLCRAMIAAQAGICWRCILYPDSVDGELVELMAEAGCVEVSLGFESGCDQILHVMNKRYTPERVRTISELLKAAGIRRMGFLMLGGPGETRETVERSFAYADSLNLEMLKVTPGIRIYPETALAETAVRDGIIAPDDDLLYPRFYMVPELGEWIQEEVTKWRAKRPNWV